MPINIKKIAIIHNAEYSHQTSLESLIKSLKAAAIECNLYENSNHLIDSGFIPDCVLVLDPHEPKLTHYPTYAILDSNPSFLLSYKRFIRNILMYDGHLTNSPLTKKIVEDLMFGARKLGSSVADFKIIPSCIKPTTKIDFSKSSAANICDRKNPFYSSAKKLTKKSLINFYRKHSLANLASGKNKEEEISKLYNKNAIGFCPLGCDDVNKNISYNLLEIIASGALAITNWSEYLYSIFGDTILYIPNHYKKAECIAKVIKYVKWAQLNPELATNKSQKANETYNNHFHWGKMIDNLNELHKKTLVDRGYVKPQNHEAFPTISYIIRTGGRPQYILKTLDSLVAQNYPNLQVIFVLYKPLKQLQEIQNKYESLLKIKIIEDFKQLRSSGIITGMKNVDTDYFGLIDDDDAIHPNHLYSLLNSLKYHNHFSPNKEARVAYSGSYYASNFTKFYEDKEWHDTLLSKKNAKRVVEHFRFYDSDLMMSHLWYMMSNSWIAHKSLINEETVRDIFTHSHEDLYFEMQFAMNTHFVFSCEMTAMHYFHDNNSTNIDKHRNQYDIFRRNLSLNFRNSLTNKFCRSDIGKPHSNINNINIAALHVAPPRYMQKHQIRISLFKKSRKVKKLRDTISSFLNRET